MLLIGVCWLWFGGRFLFGSSAFGRFLVVVLLFVADCFSFTFVIGAGIQSVLFPNVLGFGGNGLCGEGWNCCSWSV